MTNSCSRLVNAFGRKERMQYDPMSVARRRMYRQARNGGALCPCCGQNVVLRKRKFHCEMALFLIKLVKAYRAEQRWYSTRELIPATTKAATDGAYLTHWGLLERKDSSPGFYRPTLEGMAFVDGSIKVPARIHILCGNVVGFSSKQIDIKWALSGRFSYEEMMRA
jgi:hypothetical protein